MIALAAAEFDVMITVDQNMEHQQDRGDLPLPIVVIEARDIRLDSLLEFVPELLTLLNGRLATRVYVVPEAELDGRE